MHTADKLETIIAGDINKHTSFKHLFNAQAKDIKLGVYCRLHHYTEAEKHVLPATRNAEHAGEARFNY